MKEMRKKTFNSTEKPSKLYENFMICVFCPVIVYADFNGIGTKLGETGVFYEKPCICTTQNYLLFFMSRALVALVGSGPSCLLVGRLVGRSVIIFQNAES